MKRIILSILIIVLLIISGSLSEIKACTSILVSKGASKGNSVIITYSCDGEFLPHLQYKPAQDYAPGEFYEIHGWSGEIIKIKQVSHTYAVVGLMNEYQLSIGETTFDGQANYITGR